MTQPINTPKWLFKPGAEIPSPKQKRATTPKRPRGRVRENAPKDVPRIQVTRMLPHEAEIVLELHAKTLARELGREEVSSDLAQDDLNYRNRNFREYLPQARRILKQRHSVKDQQSHEFQQQDSEDTSRTPH